MHGRSIRASHPPYVVHVVDGTSTTINQQGCEPQAASREPRKLVLLNCCRKWYRDRLEADKTGCLDAIVNEVGEKKFPLQLVERETKGQRRGGRL